MKKNLELKVQLENFNDVLKNIRSLGIREPHMLYQTDTYFLTGKKRLKLRDANGESQIIYYSRPDIEGSKLSQYYFFKLTNRQKTVAEKILNIFFTVKTIVRKKRVLYLYKHTRIHLDTVEDLGNFLELETVFNKKEPRYDFYNEHNDIIDTLGLSLYKKIKPSYSDLILK